MFQMMSDDLFWVEKQEKTPVLCQLIEVMLLGSVFLNY